MLKPKQRTNQRLRLDLTDYYEEPSDKSKCSVYLPIAKRNKLYQNIRWKQLLLIYLIALVTIHYFERIKPYMTIKACIWDQWETWPLGSSPYHSVIVGDPQIVDPNSYPNSTRLRLSITKFFSDNYLHRNHNIYNRVLKPDSIIFVGDLFDGGREWNDTEWITEYKRFNRIFNQVEGTKQFRQIPGNHDVGFGNGIDFERYSRFKAFFGNADEVMHIGNHSLVLLDTVSLSCFDDEKVRKTSKEFLDSFSDPANSYMEYPRILVSHVPMYRFTELQMCGPLRESKKPFPVVRGKQYQTVLEYELSQEIINKIRPSIIFSGDDHDYCHVRYPFNKPFSKENGDYQFSKGELAGEVYTDEITVKTSAMTGGIKRPAIQLLSLWNPENKYNSNWESGFQGVDTLNTPTASTHLCYLPSPYQPIWHYINLLILSTFWIYICTVEVKFGHKLNNSFISIGNRTKTMFSGFAKNDVKSISTNYLRNPKTRLERIIDFALFEWDIESSKNKNSFYLNSVVNFLLIITTICWYFFSS